jgi:hypothetical protein
VNRRRPRRRKGRPAQRYRMNVKASPKARELPRLDPARTTERRA